MIPLCKVEVTLPRVLGPWEVRRGGGSRRDGGSRSFLGHPGLRRPATRSDVDLLVDFEPGGTRAAWPRGDRYGIVEFVGRPAGSIYEPQELSRYFRDEVVRTTQVQYAA